MGLKIIVGVWKNMCLWFSDMNVTIFMEGTPLYIGRHPNSCMVRVLYQGTHSWGFRNMRTTVSDVYARLFMGGILF